jgi:hypothetical protein
MIFTFGSCYEIFSKVYVMRAASHGVPSPKSQVTWGQSMQSQLLRARKLGLTTSHGVPSLKSQVWHGCLHGNTSWRWGFVLVLGVGSSNKVDLTLNTCPVNTLVWNKQDSLLMIMKCILMVSWCSKVGTLPRCWDLLTWVRLGTWDLMWTNHDYGFSKSHIQLPIDKGIMFPALDYILCY